MTYDGVLRQLDGTDARSPVHQNGRQLPELRLPDLGMDRDVRHETIRQMETRVHGPLQPCASGAEMREDPAPVRLVKALPYDVVQGPPGAQHHQGGQQRDRVRCNSRLHWVLPSALGWPDPSSEVLKRRRRPLSLSCRGHRRYPSSPDVSRHRSDGLNPVNGPRHPLRTWTPGTYNERVRRGLAQVPVAVGLMLPVSTDRDVVGGSEF